MTVGPWLDRSCCRRNAIRAPRGPYAVGFPWPRPSSGRWPGRRCHASRPAGHRQSVPSSGGDRPDARPIPPGRLPALSMPPGRSGPLWRSAVAAVEWAPGSRMARRVRDGRCPGSACAGLDRRLCPSVELQRPSRHPRKLHLPDHRQKLVAWACRGDIGPDQASRQDGPMNQVGRPRGSARRPTVVQESLAGQAIQERVRLEDLDAKADRI
jgi:hypothetical protein